MDAGVRYKIAPPGWTVNDSNPFSIDGTHRLGWSAFCVLDRDGDQFVTGKSGQGPFSARFERGVKDLDYRLADFLRYENAHGRTVIVAAPEDIQVEAFIERALSRAPAAHLVRPGDARVIVHSTSAEAFWNIRRCGEMLAASQLEKAREQGLPGVLDEYMKNEPPEYRDYIMFGEVDSLVPEIVVASYQKGEFVFDPRDVYQPGVRLYFDNHRLIVDGLGVRDGLHGTKVHRRLPLEPYLLSTVGVDDLDPQRQVKTWTLQEFVEATNAVFKERTGRG